jgi:hypothetical protein
VRPARLNPLRQQTSKPVVQNHARILSGNISYGTSNVDPAKNIQGWDSQNVTTPATPNTTFTVNHGLGYTPTRFQVVYNNSAGIVYDSGTSWNIGTISLKCSTGSATIRLFIY